MKYILFFIPCILLLSLACSDDKQSKQQMKSATPEDYLESVLTNPEIIPGVGIGQLKLEETRGEDLFNEHINGKSYIEQGVYLQYRNADTLIGVSIENKVIYTTPEGKTIGLSRKEVLKELGAPLSKNTPINKGKQTVGSLPSLNYRGMSITFYNDTNRIIHIYKEN